MKSLITLTIFVLTLTLLNGCSSSPSPKRNPTLPETTKEVISLSPEQLLQQANKSQDPNIRSTLLIQAAREYLKNHLIAQSSAIMREVEYEKLSADNLAKAFLINLKLGIQENIDWHTTQSINTYNQTSLSNLNIDELKVIVPLLAEAYKRQNNNIFSATLLIEYSGIFNPSDSIDLNETIWSLLRTANPIELNNYDKKNEDIDVLAWLELARSIQQNQISLESQYQALLLWMQKWPNHPAASLPPKELILLGKLPETKPSELIIALPFTGPVSKVGKAVRDGFMAAFLSQQSKSTPSKTKISFFDTNKNSIESLYASNHEENALIIGPLTKNNVNKLSNIDLSLSPTLALNYLEDSLLDPLNFPQNLYQFGLNPETEIKQLSSLLAKKKLNKIAFIAPENELGFRIHDSLLDALHENQSLIIESVYYQDQKSLSPSVATLLATDLSNQRKNKIQRITNLSMEFEPRRRNDIDAIYMLAKPQVAKQLNPLFAYHYARDLPIYSSSQIHQINEQQNDLDNILFLEMPWMLSNSIEIKQTINQSLPNSNDEYTRFYALGADAFALSARLKLLKEIQNTQLQGNTGTLTIDKNGIIHRELELAVFKKGKAIAIKE